MPKRGFNSVSSEAPDRIFDLSGENVTQRLPSTRSLAKFLGISRNTVTQSYDRLLSEGYLETIGGSGTYVCDRIPEEFLQATAIDSSSPSSRSHHSLSE